jgi:hypothetical protein
MDNRSDLRAHLFDLADQDRECLERIKQRLEINSSALAVRLALRSLAKRLNNPTGLPDKCDANPVVTPSLDAPAPVVATYPRGAFTPFRNLPVSGPSVTFDSDGITRPIGSALQLQKGEG